MTVKELIEELQKHDPETCDLLLSFDYTQEAQMWSLSQNHQIT